jgi:hypothetical protein
LSSTEERFDAQRHESCHKDPRMLSSVVIADDHAVVLRAQEALERAQQLRPGLVRCAIHKGPTPP